MAKILHIDDERELRNLVSMFLTDEGHEVISAKHGIEGLELLASTPDFNLILLDNDHKHPKIDGYIFAKLIREDPKYARYKNIPIIGLSGSFQDEAIPLLSVYLEKPFTPWQLKGAIENLCKE